MARHISKTEIVAPGFGFGKHIVTRTKRVVVTSALLDALHSAPYTAVPTPGAGKALLFHCAAFEFQAGNVAYTGGGAITPVYHGATTDLSGLGGVAAAVITGAVNDYKYLPSIVQIDVTANVGIDLLAASANFAAGNGVLIVKIHYSVLMLG